MCYTGKCIYEDYMGNCKLPDATDETCKNGYRLEKERKIYQKLYFLKTLVIHTIKYIFSRNYRKQYRKEREYFKDLF